MKEPDELILESEPVAAKIGKQEGTRTTPGGTREKVTDRRFCSGDKLVLKRKIEKASWSKRATRTQETVQ